MYLNVYNRIGNISNYIMPITYLHNHIGNISNYISTITYPSPYWKHTKLIHYRIGNISD